MYDLKNMLVYVSRQYMRVCINIKKIDTKLYYKYK